MKDTDTRGDTFWQYSWECKGEESSVLMDSDGLHAAGTMNEPVSSLSVHDDMTSWLHLDDPTYCSQIFGPSADRATNTPSSSSSLQVYRDSRLLNMHHKDPKAPSNDAEAALALAAGRAAGYFPQTGAEAFQRSRTVCQPTTSKVVNGSPVSRASYATWCHGSPSSHSAGHATAGVSASAGALNFPQLCVSVSQGGCDTSPLGGDPSNFSWKSQTTNSLESDRSTLECRSPRVGGSCRVTSSYDCTKVSQETSKNTLTSSDGRIRSEKEVKRKEKDVEDTAGNEDSAEKKKPPRSSKRSRAAEVHNLSERKRRDRINERMRALQELIPNSNKTDKASMLDEAIEYLKMLQHQLQVMSMRTGIMPGVPHMQMPPVTAAYGGMPIRLVDVSGLPSHAHGPLSLNVALPMNMTQTGYLQGMNSDVVYHSQVLNQAQHQQQQQQQQQLQLQEHPYNQTTQIHKQENE